MILAFVVIITNNNVFAQTLHDRTLDEMVNQTDELKNSTQIEVGDSPIAIGINTNTNRVYVVNYRSDSVSVIDGDTNQKIIDIPVGDSPRAIGINQGENKIYVTHLDSNKVSVIDGYNNTKIEDIPVGDGPMDIFIDEPSNSVIVANYRNNSISVFDNDKKKYGIKTTGRPLDIDFDNKELDFDNKELDFDNKD